MLIINGWTIVGLGLFLLVLSAGLWIIFAPNNKQNVLLFYVMLTLVAPLRVISLRAKVLAKQSLDEMWPIIAGDVISFVVMVLILVNTSDQWFLTIIGCYLFAGILGANFLALASWLRNAAPQIVRRKKD